MKNFGITTTSVDFEEHAEIMNFHIRKIHNAILECSKKCSVSIFSDQQEQIEANGCGIFFTGEILSFRGILFNVCPSVYAKSKEMVMCNKNFLLISKQNTDLIEMLDRINTGNIDYESLFVFDDKDKEYYKRTLGYEPENIREIVKRVSNE